MKEEIMITKKCLILFLAVFVIVAMLVFSNSVGFAQEITFKIESQTIRIETEGAKSLCVVLHQTGCKAEVKYCDTGEIISSKTRTSVQKLFFNDKHVPVSYIKTAAPCDIFISHFDGNTYWVCIGGECTPY
jgi:hypothetical protein